MRRRDFIWALAGAAVWPHATRAQEPARLRRIAVLWGGVDDPAARSKIALFQQTLADLGWAEGRNVQFDLRWGGNEKERVIAYARELIALNPAVIFVGPTNALVPLMQQTRSIPIVFVRVSDPLGRGVVDSLARPSGNITGFSNLEFSLVGKYLQLLKEIAPGTARVGLMIHVSNAVSDNWFRMFKKVASSFAVEPIAAPIRERSDIARTIEALAREPNGGLIVPGDTFVDTPEARKLIVGLTASHRLPALYTRPEFVREGGLMGYGVDQDDPFRGAASYVDRILKGEKTVNLPVQQPSKFDLIINLKTARTLGLTVPLTLQASANEVVN